MAVLKHWNGTSWEEVGSAGAEPTLSTNAVAKSVLVDADTVYGGNSASGFSTIKSTWTNVKTLLKTYFDTVYTTTSAVATQITTALSSYATTAYVTSALASFKTTNFLDFTSSGQTQLDAKATKSMSAYSFRVNNTNATADSTETVYKALGKQIQDEFRKQGGDPGSVGFNL